MDHIEDAELAHAVEILKDRGMVAVMPRLSPDEKAQEAVEQIGFELNCLNAAIRQGGKLSDKKRQNLATMGAVMARIAIASN